MADKTLKEKYQDALCQIMIMLDKAETDVEFSALQVARKTITEVLREIEKGE